MKDEIRAPKDHPMTTPSGRVRKTKECGFCGLYKRPEHFYLDDRFTFGLSFWCIACTKRLAP